jgi:hypothetical protein
VREIECYCGERVPTDFADSVDLDGNPRAADEILEGTFMSLECPHCGTLLKPELPVRVHSTSGGFEVFLVPELDRNAFLRGTLEYEIGDPARVAIGYPELVEKLRIWREGLDDSAVEVVKYYLLSRALENEEQHDVRILFVGREPDGRLRFQIEGLRDREVALSRVAEATYHRAKERLHEIAREEPFSEILQRPYVSVNRIYRAL